MSISAQWYFRAALLAASLLFAAAVGEIAVRIMVPQDLSIWDNTRDGITIHRTHADVYLPTYKQRIRTNNLGMRDRDRTLQTAPGLARILLFGDSFLEAIQVSYEESFPALLAERLSSASPVETVNLAVSGWGTDDQVTYLERHGLPLGPDGILIMMTLHNDLSDNGLLEFHMLDESGLVSRPVSLFPWFRFMTQKLKARLAGTSHLYRLAHHTWVRGDVQRGATQLNHHVAQLMRRQTPPDLEAQWTLTLALLDKAHNLAQQRSAWMAVALIPLSIQVDDEKFEAFVTAHRLSSADLDRNGPQRRVLEWGALRGVEVIDLLPAFRSEGGRTDEILYLPNDGHWSRLSHRIAAEEVASELINRSVVTSVRRE